ncbi:hypothetical protein AMTRI_Chr06g195510 [Amborella trichopoda]
MLSFLQNHYKRSYIYPFFVDLRGIRDERERALRLLRTGIQPTSQRPASQVVKQVFANLASKQSATPISWRGSANTLLLLSSLIFNTKRSKRYLPRKGNTVALSKAQSKI